MKHFEPATGRSSSAKPEGVMTERLVPLGPARNLRQRDIRNVVVALQNIDHRHHGGGGRRAAGGRGGRRGGGASPSTRSAASLEVAYLLVVLEKSLCENRPRLHHVPVRQHQALLGVHDETRGLGGARPRGVKGPGGVHLQNGWGDSARQGAFRRHRWHATCANCANKAW